MSEYIEKLKNPQHFCSWCGKKVEDGNCCSACGKRFTLNQWQIEMLDAIQSGKKIVFPTHRAAGQNRFKRFLKENFPEEYKKVFPDPVTDGGKAFHFAIQDDHI